MGGVPWYAVALMLAGPAILGAGRLAVVVARRLGWPRDPRPGYIDLTERP